MKGQISLINIFMLSVFLLFFFFSNFGKCWAFFFVNKRQASPPPTAHFTFSSQLDIYLSSVKLSSTGISWIGRTVFEMLWLHFFFTKSEKLAGKKVWCVWFLCDLSVPSYAGLKQTDLQCNCMQLFSSNPLKSVGLKGSSSVQVCPGTLQ